MKARSASAEGACFQFLGIPPKGERERLKRDLQKFIRGFQFLGIPPKGELLYDPQGDIEGLEFPISRDPPEGGTSKEEENND